MPSQSGFRPRTSIRTIGTRGFFQAKGALKNDAAVESGDELPPEAAYISCSKSTNTCTVTTADVFDHFLNLDSTDYDIETWNEHQITFKTDFAVCATSSYAIDREAETFTLTVRKKAIIPVYALQSPLHPCEGKVDEDISLAGGFPVYWHLLKAYEQRNGIYFHLALVALNVAYFAGVLWIARLRRRRALADQI